MRRRIGGGPDAKEHVLVMERHLGRKLLPSEEVHHLYGDRSDNAIERLELWDTSHPAGQRVSDKIEFYTDFLARHGLCVREHATMPQSLEVSTVYFQV